MKQLIAAFAATCLITGPAYAAPAETDRARTSAEAASQKSSNELKVRSQLLNGLKPADDISPRLAKIKAAIESLSGPKATKQSQQRSLKTGLKEINALDQSLAKLRGGLQNAERRVGSLGGPESVDEARNDLDDLRQALEDRMKDLESEDKMGNFEIQDLMSRYNQSEQLASSVQKKVDDTSNAVISKVG